MPVRSAPLVAVPRAATVSSTTLRSSVAAANIGASRAPRADLFEGGGAYHDANRDTTRLDAPAGGPHVVVTPRTFASVDEAFERIGCTRAGKATATPLTTNNDKWVARWLMPPGDAATSYYTVQQDIFGFAFLGKLLLEQRAGHQQRLIVDSFANQQVGFTAPHNMVYLRTLATHGAEVGVYNELHKRGPMLVSHLLTGDYAAGAQTHDKIYAKNGVAVIGGSNIGQDYFSDRRDYPDAWRDTDVLIRSADALDVVGGAWQAVDVELNHHVTTSIGPAHGRGKEAELLGAYAMMDAWLSAPALSEAEKRALRADPVARERMADDLLAVARTRLADPGRAEHVDRLEPDELAKLEALARGFTDNLELRGAAHGFAERTSRIACDAKILDQTSAAGTNQTQIAPGMADLIASARESIYFENPYVCFTESEVALLEAAAKRGVKIVIGTNSPTSTDSAATQAFFLRDWEYLEARIPGLEIFVSTKTKLHAKAGTIDGKVSWVGTANADLISRFINSEVLGVYRSAAMAKHLNERMRADREDPANGVVQYRINKDAEGRPVLDAGRPVVDFGPEHHLPTGLRLIYGIATRIAGAAVNVLPSLQPMRHPSL